MPPLLRLKGLQVTAWLVVVFVTVAPALQANEVGVMDVPEEATSLWRSSCSHVPDSSTLRSAVGSQRIRN